MGWLDHFNDGVPEILLDALRQEGVARPLSGLCLGDDIGSVLASCVEVVVEAAERLWAYQRQDGVLFLPVSGVMCRLGLDQLNCPFGRELYRRLEIARDAVGAADEQGIACIIERVRARRMTEPALETGVSAPAVECDELSEDVKATELPAPATECYAELTCLSSVSGTIKILFTKQGSGRPTTVGSIAIKGQPFSILLAGLALAKRKMKEAEETLSSARLPDEFKIALEWTADSLGGSVKPNATARRKAIQRLRDLVTFQDGVGLVTEQNEHGVWTSTVPFRLAASGQP